MTKHILIVEDSNTQARIIGRLFERHGMSIDHANTLAAARRLLQSRAYHLIVLDVFVGEENTLEFLPHLRELGRSVPIAAMTSGRPDRPLSASHALNQARRAKVDFLLPKPFSAEDVLQVLEDAQAIHWEHGICNRIVLIENDPQNRKLYSTWLEGDGFSVAAVESVQTALRRLDVARAETVILNLAVTDEETLPAIQMIHSAWPELFILGLTDPETDCEFVSTALSRGVADVLQQPVSQDTLLAFVRKVRAPPDVSYI